MAGWHGVPAGRKMTGPSHSHGVFKKPEAWSSSQVLHKSPFLRTSFQPTALEAGRGEGRGSVPWFSRVSRASPALPRPRPFPLLTCTPLLPPEPVTVSRGRPAPWNPGSYEGASAAGKSGGLEWEEGVTHGTEMRSRGIWGGKAGRHRGWDIWRV